MSLLDQQAWGDLVQDLKDAEKPIPASKTEDMARSMLTWIRKYRLKQPQLFQKQRGEEYEIMIATLSNIYGEEPVIRMVENEALWKATLVVARR
uniref:Uncharacterized protein n=1 Tax=viral metagenome TaxID=1070528 RepID=A0A6C0J7N6_9ZZZZ